MSSSKKSSKKNTKKADADAAVAAKSSSISFAEFIKISLIDLVQPVRTDVSFVSHTGL